MRSSTPTILLLQARRAGDAMLEHELSCFADRCRLPNEAFYPVNMATTPLREDLLDDVDAVMIGGAGEFSLVEGDFAWRDDLLTLMRRLAERDLPTFASCFGFQALVVAFGGKLVADPEMAEVGTHQVILTDQGRGDPFFGTYPDQFYAQFGHNDSVVDLPDDFIWLAHSNRCDYQAIRHRSAPIVATQFHPELAMGDNIERYVAYLQNYEGEQLTLEEARQKARSMHRKSPHASNLLCAFVDEVLLSRTKRGA
ncbi:MAG: type 1 glutamine amidotransferase [Persicimonas sp.]